MKTKNRKQKNSLKTITVRRAYIPANLDYMTNTEFGQKMMGLAEEIAQEQGKRSSKEIARLIKLIRGSVSINRIEQLAPEERHVYSQPQSENS